MELKITDYDILDNKLEMFVTTKDITECICSECGTKNNLIAAYCSKCDSPNLELRENTQLVMKKVINTKVYTIYKDMPRYTNRLLNVLNNANKLDNEFWITKDIVRY